MDMDDLGLMGQMDDGAAAPSAPLPSTATHATQPRGAAAPTASHVGRTTSSGGEVDEDDIPLLEELGIDFKEIWLKTLAIVFPISLSAAARGKAIFTVAPLSGADPVTTGIDSNSAAGSGDNAGNVTEGADLAGPLVFCLLLGTFLLLAGKVHFGYIYGFGFTGCALLWLVLNLMADAALTLDQTMHVLGYCLAPIVALAGIAVVASLKGTIGQVLSACAVAWSTAVATRCFEASLGMREQRYLIAYPVALLYTCFAFLAIF